MTTGAFIEPPHLYDVRPRNTIHDSSDRHVADTKLTRNGFVRDSCRGLLPDGSYLSIGKFCLMTGHPPLAWMRAEWSPFLNRIRDVISSRSDKEVIGVKAWRIIAAVTDKKRAIENEPKEFCSRQAMRRIQLRTNSHLAVAKSIPIAGPVPAPRNRINFSLGQEPRPYRPEGSSTGSMASDELQWGAFDPSLRSGRSRGNSRCLAATTVAVPVGDGLAVWGKLMGHGSHSFHVAPEAVSAALRLLFALIIAKGGR